MILLIGGTSETAPLAEALAVAGFKVLVSTATQVPLDVGKHPNITSRSGILDGEGMAQVAAERGARAIVDASHPYSLVAHANAKKVALDLSIPYFRWMRPPAAKMGTPYSLLGLTSLPQGQHVPSAGLCSLPPAPETSFRTCGRQTAPERYWSFECYLIPNQSLPAEEQG